MHRFAGDSAADIFEDEMSAIEQFEAAHTRQRPTAVAVKPSVAGAPDQQAIARTIMQQIAKRQRAEADRIDAALANDHLSKALCAAAMGIDLSAPTPMDVNGLMFVIAFERFGG